jgi:hypothetical protein
MIERGMTERQAAACLSVAPTTAHRWKQRWLRASPAERSSATWTADRCSRPHRSPARTPAALEARVCAERRRTGWGPRLIAGTTGVAHSTVHAVLRRHGLSRIPKPPREAVVRFEWPCPGDLLQMDTKRFARFTRPGHRVTGIRDRTGAEKRMNVGWEFCHSIIDDHSRIAYSELHDDEHAATVVAFLERALGFYAGLGITPTRLQTDNAWTYTHNNALAALLEREGIRHRTIPPRPEAQRQDSALPTDARPRMGLRTALPLKHRPSGSTATLAQPLQPRQAPLRNRQPATHQPRSQPPRAGHLIWPSFCQGSSANGQHMRAFLVVGRGGGPGVCATRGQPDMRGLGTAGPGFVSEPAV